MAGNEAKQTNKDTFLGPLLALPWRLILKRSCVIVVCFGSLGLLRNLTAVPSLPWIYERPVIVEFSPQSPETADERSEMGNGGDKEVLKGLDLEQALDEYNFGGVFLDAREIGEYGKGHIHNAISLPVALAEQALPSEVDALDRKTRLVVYCDESVCDSSEELGLLLKKRYGFEDVCVFKGGWEAWRDADYPTETLEGGGA